MKPRDRSRRYFARPLGTALGWRGRQVPRWLWLALGVWLVWVTVLSDHSLWRIAQLKREIAQAERDTRDLKRTTTELEAQLNDPYTRRLRAEEIARTEHGWAAPGEIVYRFRNERAQGDTAH